jgi:S-adenosylmethionine:tRNA-ribosyltransferase-isomerase (queuine synthetase)
MAFKLTKVNSLPGENISVDTDDVPELVGATNLYYTQARTNSDIVSHRNTNPTIQDKHFYTIGEIALKVGDLYWQILSDIEIISVQAVLKENPVGGKVNLAIVKNLGSALADTLFTLDIFPNDNLVISNTSAVTLQQGDYIRVDVLQVGSTTAGSDLTVSFKYRSIF